MKEGRKELFKIDLYFFELLAALNTTAQRQLPLISQETFQMSCFQILVSKRLDLN